MARSPIYSHWYLELDDQCGRRAADDGFVVFEMLSRRIWAAVYEMEDASPQSILAEHSVGSQDAQCQFPFRSDTCLRGHSALSQRDRTRVLETWTATRGEVANLAFEWENETDIEWALAAWRSIEHRPPEWVRFCISSEASLFRLRRALQRDVGIEDALNDLQQRGHMRQAAQMLVLALRDDTAIVRQSACYALGCIEGYPEATSALSNHLDDESALVRVRAAEALYRHEVSPAGIIEVLVTVLEQEDPSPLPSGEARIQGPCGYLCVPEGRYFAAMVLGEIGPVAKEQARPALFRRLHDDSGCVRVMSARALVSQGESPAAVIPALLDALTDEKMSKRERVRIAEAIFEFGHPVDVVVPVLTDVVRNSEWRRSCRGM